MTIKRDSQNADILIHLAKGGKITRLSAFTVFGIQNLTARISELRRVTESIFAENTMFVDGTDGIVKTIKTDANGQEYASYSIPCRPCRQLVGVYLNSLRRRAA